MFSRRQIRLACWSVCHLQNWAEVIQSRRILGPLSDIRMRNGLRLAVSEDERQMLFEVFGDHAYDHPAILPPKDGTVVDIGANVGIYSIYAATRLVPFGRVVAFEPNPACASKIRHNCALNGITNIEIRELAVASTDGQISFHVAARSGDGSVFAPDHARESITVKSVSANTFLQSIPRADLMKIDCEGGEHPLLWQSEPRQWERVRAICMEYHLGFNTGFPDESPDQVEQRLAYLGFRSIQRTPTSDSRFGYIAALHM